MAGRCGPSATVWSNGAASTLRRTPPIWSYTTTRRIPARRSTWLQRALYRLVAGGLASREWVVKPPPVLRSQVWYRRAEDCPDPQELEVRAPRQAEALAALGTGERCAAELREAGVDLPAVGRLERNGWVLRRELPPLGMDPRGCSLADSGHRPELSEDQRRAGIM